MSADRSRIASEGSQMAALLVEGSPLQMEKGVGGVRAHGGIDRSGNKNTTAIANGNNNKVGSSSNNYDLSRHGIWEQPNTEIAKEQEELDYIDDVRDSCVSSAVNNSHTIREGSILDLNSYFLSHSMRNNHKRIEEPFSIRFKEQSHIKHQIQNYLENCVHVQVQHTLESKLPQSQVKLPSDDGTAATGLSPLSLSSCDNMNATPLSQTTTTAASRLEPSLMIEKHTELRSIKEELEEIELKEVQILAEQAQLYRRKQKLLQNCFSKSNTTQCASVHKSSPIYHKHYYSSSVSSSGPQPQSMMTSDTECPPPLSHHPSSKTPPPSPLEQSVEYHKLHCQTYQPHGISGSGIFIEQKGGEKGNKLLSSTAMSPLSGIGLSEMELADASTSLCDASLRSIATSGDTASWGGGGGDNVRFPSSPCSSTFTGQTSLLIPRARYSLCASPRSSQEGGQSSADSTSVPSLHMGQIMERPFQSNKANSTAAHYFSNQRSAFMTL